MDSIFDHSGVYCLQHSYSVYFHSCGWPWPGLEANTESPKPLVLPNCWENCFCSVTISEIWAAVGGKHSNRPRMAKACVSPYPATSSLDAQVKLKQRSLFLHGGINWILSYHYCSGNHLESPKYCPPSWAAHLPLYSIQARKCFVSFSSYVYRTF